MEAVIAGRLARLVAMVAVVWGGLLALGPGAVGVAAPGQQEPAAAGACRTVIQTPVHAGDPVISEVILVSTGEVVATKTGDGPFVPADYADRCLAAGTSSSVDPTTASSADVLSARGDACRTVIQTPVHAGDPVIAEVILVSTGEVVATKTGDGPFLPVDYESRCEESSTTAPAPGPAKPVPGVGSYTG